MTETAYVIVTAANRGLGLAFLKRLCHAPPILPLKIIATSRVLPATVHITSPDNVSIEWYTLDLCSSSSIESFVWILERKHGKKIDVLINNAGFYGDDKLPYAFPTCVASIGTNFEGTHKLTRALLPLMRRPGHPALCARSRVVNISSPRSRATIEGGYSERTLRSLAAANTVERLYNIAHTYKQAFRTNQLRAYGWPVGKPHEVSKLLLNCMTRILALQNRDILINACMPGSITTVIRGVITIRNPEDSALTPATLAFEPTMDTTGDLWEGEEVEQAEDSNLHVVDWIE